MLHINSDQWLSWLNLYFWPLLRVLALISTAPVLSEAAVSKRVKIGLALLITILLAPSLHTPLIALFSAQAILVALQQILIGVALGLTMQLAFVAIRTAGEIIGLQMGLSFATFFDPSTHLNMPILARLLNLLAILLFLSFNGHLWLISLLAESFYNLPVSSQLLNGDIFMGLARAGSLIFLNGLMLALPLIILLLTLNIALGILNRMSPQLSVFVVGFPLTLNVGILVIMLLMPLLAPFSERLFNDIFHLLANIIGS